MFSPFQVLGFVSILGCLFTLPAAEAARNQQRRAEKPEQGTCIKQDGRYGSQEFANSLRSAKNSIRDPEDILFSIGDFLTGAVCLTYDSVSKPLPTAVLVGKHIEKGAIVAGKATADAGRSVKEAGDKAIDWREQAFTPAN